MIQRLIPLTLAIFATFSAFAQVPKIVNTEGPTDTPPNFVVTCPAGVSAFAGTSSQTLFPAAQSNDVEFLCMGDQLEITHLGGQTFGDPDASSAPGISYIFYNCPPSISGIDYATVLTDPCHINPNVNIIAVQSGVDIFGNATFTNDGLVQTTFNAGNPTELFFAPVTLDDFTNFSWENDGMGGPTGPCIHSNINDAFRVVYLNPIEGLNVNPAADGPCIATFELSGGLPQFDFSNYTNVSISLATDPSVTANIDGSNFTHGDLVTFTVPEPGFYNVVVEDGKSCAASFTVNMNNCSQLITTGDDVFTLPGQIVCVDVIATGFTNIASFQYTIEYDPTILAYQTINAVNIPPDLLFGQPSAGNITVSWNDGDFPPDGETLADGTVMYEICFMAIGAVGETSPIDFTGNLTAIEVTEAENINTVYEIGYDFESGSVTISSNTVILDLTSCSTTAALNMGTISVTANGGTAPYNVVWFEVGNPGNNGMETIFANNMTIDISDLPPGTYDITVEDVNGDIQNGTIVVANVDPLFIQTIPTNPDCPGGTDGSIVANINGGVSPISILWSNGATTNINGPPLNEGIYSVTVTDANGCTSESQNSIGAEPIEFDTTLLQHITCTGGDMSGAIAVAASGGTAPFTYSWSNGGLDSVIVDIPAGSYTVTAMDANMCTAILSITVNSPISPIIIGFDSIPVNCPNDVTGELTPIIQPGNSSDFTYAWDAAAGNQTTATAFGLSAGTFSVTITDGDDCTAEASFTLWSQPPLVLTYEATEPNCPEDNNGLIQLQISGGSTPYQIIWANGSAFPVLPSLVCDSTYSVTVIDAAGCDTIIENIYLNCPPAIQNNFNNLGDVSCDGGVPCNGTATANASSGTAGTGVYNYTWSSGESNALAVSSTAVQLCQGLQVVEINDGLCSITDTVEIGAPSPIGFDLTNPPGTDVSCFGGSDGSATIVATGGTPGYTYQWTNPAGVSGPSISGVPAGTYSLIITDANNCIQPLSFQIGEPDLLVASIDSTNSFDVSCFGEADGQIAVQWVPGNPGPATYDWEPNVSNTSTATTNIGVGTYTVTITDQKGCSDEVSYTVGQPEPIVAMINPPEPPVCNGDQTVVTLDTVYGGAGTSYTFNVDFGPPQFEDSAIPILAGPHTVTVFDADGCSSEYMITVNEPFPVEVLLPEDTTIELGETYQINSTIFNGIIGIDSISWSPLTYLQCGDLMIDSLCEDPYVTPLETTEYTLTVVDTNGCFGSDQIIVDIDKNRNVYIPNAFSPNGDGPNDLFKIYTGVGVEQVNYFRIFDRWGEQVYQDNGFLPGDFYIGGWDGRFKGKLMGAGVYIYIAEVVFIDGIVLLYRGDVTLLK